MREVFLALVAVVVMWIGVLALNALGRVKR